jgi:hypothetical protein
MKKVDIYTFDTTPEQLKKEGRIFLPHSGYTYQSESKSKRELFEELLEDQRSS